MTTGILKQSVSYLCLPFLNGFAERGVGYIYGRYKHVGDTSMDESFFPVLWTRYGYRTPYLDEYCLGE